MSRIVYVAVTAALLLPTSALAEVYRWKDEDGNVHYSGQPRSDNGQSEVDPDIRPADPDAGNSRDDYGTDNGYSSDDSDYGTDDGYGSDDSGYGTSDDTAGAGAGNTMPSAECRELREKVREVESGDRRILPDKADLGSKRGKTARRVALGIAKTKLKKECQ